MPKLFRRILSASRKRRCLLAGFALWLLKIARDVEESEMCRYSDELDKLSLNPGSAPRHKYAAIEDECLNCEHALGFLECAIDDLKFAY